MLVFYYIVERRVSAHTYRLLLIEDLGRRLDSHVLLLPCQLLSYEAGVDIIGATHEETMYETQRNGCVRQNAEDFGEAA